MNRTRNAPLAVAAILILAACSTAPAATLAPDATTIDAIGAVLFDGSHVDVDTWADAAAGEGVVIVDVRSPEEYAEGHIAGAINIDVSGASFSDEVTALDPDGEYAVYCRSGNRSRAAIDTMATLGVENTLGLEGGITAWIDSGNAVTSS